MLLLPYHRRHVLRYHEWMTSPTLQTLTASEPLSLEDEYAMQQSWHDDDESAWPRQPRRPRLHAAQRRR